MRSGQNTPLLAHFIGGRLQAGGSEDTIELVNPASAETIARIPGDSGARAAIEQAVEQAAIGLRSWMSLRPSERTRILRQFAALVAEHAEELDRLDAVDMGKPISVQLFNAAAGAALLSYFAAAAESICGDVLSSDQGSYVTQRWAPRGIVGAVVPWNFPSFIALLKIAPALAAGNSVVLKPSELSPRSALRLAELGLKAGLPCGTLNVVLGRGDAGRALALHDRVDMISFTGSTEVGKRVVQCAGQSNMKTVIAECGGKSPQIVFADGVDLDAAADSIAGLVLTNQGQICSAGSRLLVERSIEGELVERIVERMSRVVIGDPLDPVTTFGPLASATQFERVTAFIASALADGAQLVAGGHRPSGDAGPNFIEPTLFRNVAPNSQLAQEEVFGPVLAVCAFDDEREALSLANSTRFGLAAYVWTTDFSRAMRMREINSSVWIYGGKPVGEGAGHATPLEPYGLSGIGVEGGRAGLQSYMRRQTLLFHHIQ